MLDKAGITSERLDTTGTIATAMTRISEYLVGHQDTDAVIGLGSVLTEVEPQAVAEAGLMIPIGGFDLSPDIIYNILGGKIVATVDSGAYYEGYMPVVMLYYYNKYGVRPSSIPIGGMIIDKENGKLVK